MFRKLFVACVLQAVMQALIASSAGAAGPYGSIKIGAWIGGALTAALFSLGKMGFEFYLVHATIASTYGVAGSLVVLLLWVYYSSQILFFGAEFIANYSRQTKT